MKVSGPLLSARASGTLADVLTFSQRRSGQQVRYQAKQKDAQSAGQLSQRDDFEMACSACRFMAYGEGDYGNRLYGVDAPFWNARASGQQMSGYNLCVQEYLPLV